MKQSTKSPVVGLEQFKLTEAAFRLLRNRNVQAYVHLRTYEVTAALRKIPPSNRFRYMAVRVDRWIKTLRRLHPQVTIQLNPGKLAGGRRWSQLPSSLAVRGSACEVLAMAGAKGISSIYIAKVAGRRLRPAESTMEWYCVRALVVIRVERAKTGLQQTEDRFMLVRASSVDDAKRRLKQKWHEYARPYLNSDGRIVSWQFDRVVDVYETSEKEIDPAGTEVYSKLSGRRMRPSHVWRPSISGPLFKPTPST